MTAFLDELGFAVVDDDTAVGELREFPVSVTVLGVDPPSMMFQIRVHPDGTQTQPVLDLMQGVPEEQARLSFEDGSVWLSLYDMSGLDIPAFHQLLEGMVDTLRATDFAVGPGCLRCGEDGDDVQKMYVDGRPTRLCTACFEEADRDRQELETELNQTSLGATLGLPGAALFVAAGWAGFWTLIDITFEFFRIRFVDVNILTVPLMLVLLGVVGWALGWPTGTTLRRSAAIRKAPRILSLLFALVTAIAGETLYVGIYLLRVFGVFDLGIAAQVMGAVVAGYTGFWICCKLGLLAALAFFCTASATERQTVKLDV